MDSPLPDASSIDTFDTFLRVVFTYDFGGFTIAEANTKFGVDLNDPIQARDYYDLAAASLWDGEVRFICEKLWPTGELPEHIQREYDVVAEKIADEREAYNELQIRIAQSPTAQYFLEEARRRDSERRN